MKTLSENWISEGLIDFEYKKYILLAYLQHVSKHFDEETLYPMLADLIFHHQNLVVIRANQRDANEHFPRQLQRLDLEDFTLQYEALMHNDDYIEEIAQIINYAIPKIENCLQTGRNVYDQVENALEIQPVGIVPINAEAGYLLLVNGRHTQTNVFAYQLSFFENANEKFRAMLRGLGKEFYHSNVTTQQVEEYISAKTGLDLKTFFAASIIARGFRFYLLSGLFWWLGPWARPWIEKYLGVVPSSCQLVKERLILNSKSNI